MNFSPRLGFNWDVNSDSRLDLLQGGMITDVNEMIDRLGFQTEVTPEDGVVPSSIAGVDPDFKMFLIP